MRNLLFWFRPPLLLLLVIPLSVPHLHIVVEAFSYLLHVTHSCCALRSLFTVWTVSAFKFCIVLAWSSNILFLTRSIPCKFCMSFLLLLISLVNRSTSSFIRPRFSIDCKFAMFFSSVAHFPLRIHVSASANQIWTKYVLLFIEYNQVVNSFFLSCGYILKLLYQILFHYKYHIDNKPSVIIFSHRRHVCPSSPISYYHLYTLTFTS